MVFAAAGSGFRNAKGVFFPRNPHKAFRLNLKGKQVKQKPNFSPGTFSRKTLSKIWLGLYMFIFNYRFLLGFSGLLKFLVAHNGRRIGGRGCFLSYYIFLLKRKG